MKTFPTYGSHRLADPRFRTMVLGAILKLGAQGWRSPDADMTRVEAQHSGCAALAGYNRDHAVLGGSDACVATYPGDGVTALVAFAAEVELFSPAGTRVVLLDNFFREPGEERFATGESVREA